jgi:hypothetical protein
MNEVYGIKPMENSNGSKPEGVASQAKALGRDLKNKASELTDSVTRTAKDQMAELGTAAKGLAADAQGKVQQAVNEQKSAGADYIGNIAQAIHRAAGEFEGDVPQAAQYIRKAAGQIETVANAVRDRNVRDLVGEVEQFARRQPALFFGGAMMLGFAAIRFLKTTTPNPGAGSDNSGSTFSSPSISPEDPSYLSQPR